MKRLSIALLVSAAAVVACGSPRRAALVSPPAAPPARNAKQTPSANPSLRPSFELPAGRPEITSMVDRTPPRGETPAAIVRPKLEVVTLKSGVRAVIAEMPGETRIEVAVVALRGQADFDDNAQVTGAVLLEALPLSLAEGSPRNLRDDAESLGGQYVRQIANHYARIAIDAPAPVFEDAARLVLAHAFRPQLDEATTIAARKLASANATSASTNTYFRAAKSWYGEKHPFAQPQLWRAQEMLHVEPAALAALHGRLFDRRHVVLFAAGAVTKADAVAAFERTPIPAAPNGPELAARNVPAATAKEALLVSDTPGKSESMLAYVSTVLPVASDANRATLEIIAEHLSRHQPNKDTQCFEMVVAARDHDRFHLNLWGPRAATTQRLRAVLAELDRLRTRTLTDTELERAKGQVREELSGRFWSPPSVVAGTIDQLVRGAAPNADASVLDAVERVTPEDVRRVAAANLAAGSVRVFAVGDFNTMRSDLVALGLGEPARHRTQAEIAAAEKAAAEEAQRQRAAALAPPPPAATPAHVDPPAPSFDDSAEREAEARRSREAREAREEQRRAEDAAEERRARAEAEREREEADRRFQDQMRQIQEDFRRQLEGQRGQAAGVVQRVQEQQRQREAEAQRQRDEAKRRAEERDRERDRQKADRDRREREQRAQDEQRERDRREAAKRAADEARQRNEETRRRMEEDKRKNDELLRKAQEESRRIAEKAREDRERAERERAERERQEQERRKRGPTCADLKCPYVCCQMPPDGRSRCLGKGSACPAF